MPSSGNDGGGPRKPVRQRRPRGEPRRLLLEAARDLFNRKGYSSTSIREIAEQADVSEALLYRNFRTKASLFREAMVQPFADAIDEEIERHAAPSTRRVPSYDEVRSFVGSLYTVFREHRALAAMVFAADALVESDVAESGVIDDVRVAVDRFVRLAADLARANGTELDPASHGLAIRGHMAMIAGAATFGQWYFGAESPPPGEDAVVDELTNWVLARYALEDLDLSARLRP